MVKLAVYVEVDSVLDSVERGVSYEILSEGKGLSCGTLIYAVGNLWFSFVYSSEKAFFASLAITCLPYFIPDCIKIFLAAYVSKRLETAAHI